MSGWIPLRLRPVLGMDLDAIDAAALERLVGFPEDTDLEFKREPWGLSEGEKKECALDIADKANAGGALIVIGGDEGTAGDGKLAAFSPVTEAHGDLGLRIHQIVAERVSPPPLLTHRALAVDGGHVHLLGVAPTVRAPHSVAVGGGALRYPVRSGVTRRFLSEPEVADWYRRRMTSALEQTQRLDHLHADGLALVPEKKDGEPWSWLAVTSVPEFGGRLELRRGLAEEWEQWLNSSVSDFPGYNRSTRLRVLPAFRSMRVNDSLNRSDGVVYATAGWLGLDGSGVLVVGYLGGAGERGSAPGLSIVYDEYLLADVINLLGRLASHAARSGAVGNLSVAAELVSTASMTLGECRSMSSGPLSGTFPVVVSTGRSEHTVPMESVVADGMELLAAARLIVGDLGSAFGQPEVEQIAASGELVLDRFARERHAAVTAWAAAAGVDVVPSWPPA